MSSKHPWLAIVFVAALSSATGCTRDEVSHFQVPKEQAAPAAMPAPMGGMVSPPAGDVATPPAPSGANALKWTLPKGWKQQGMSGGMRYATLTPPVAGRVDVSVVVLPGPAGGELANVNRWRGQIGLAPVDEPALASMRRRIRTQAGAVALYDFASEGNVKSRMTAAMLSAGDGSTWFVKMVGDAGPVGSARADFIHLVESLRFD